MMDYKKLASSLLKDVGGKENIEKVIHCATRLRFTLRDELRADAGAIQDTRGVSGLVKGNGQFQVIIGPDVASVYSALVDLGVQSGDGVREKKKGRIWDGLLDFIASCFTPVVGVITAGGMLQVLLSVLAMAGVLSDTGDTYLVLYQVSQAAFYFIPIYLGYSIADKFQIDPFLGMMLGGVLVLPEMTNLLSREGGAALFGLPLQGVAYGASVAPILLGVWFMSLIYKLANRWSPSCLKFILRPLVTIAVTAPVVLLLLGPLGTYIGNYVADFLSFLLDGYAPLAVMFMGAFAQLLVMTGMHYCLMPILMASMTTFGYDGLIVPGMLIGISAETGVCLAVALKSRNSDWRQLGFSTAVTSCMGISEPALYGVTLKLKKPLIAIIAAGACGGLYAGLTGVKAYALVASFAALPTFMSTISNFANACISVAVTVIAAFVLTWILVKKGDLDKKEKAEHGAAKKNEQAGEWLGKEFAVGSCAAGTVKKLQDVGDQAFASGALGKGAAIEPEDGVVRAPADGIVTAAFPTKHAIGLTTAEGAQILIHIGINTVNLGGEGFSLKISQDQEVSEGDVLVEFDPAFLKEKGYDPTVIVTVTNTDDYLDVIPALPGKVTCGEKLLTILA